MTPEPKTASPDLLASAALELINSSSITALFVVEDGRACRHHPRSRSASGRRRLT
jgi:CBS domain-containing protein